MNNIALGKFIPMDSFVHHLDPRIKILSMLFIMIAVFIPGGFWAYGLIGGFVLVSVVLSKLKLSFLWRAMKPMLFMLVFLFIINLLVIQQGRLLFTIFGIKIYDEAIIQTLYIVVRLGLMIIITTILTATTPPMQLTLGIEDLLKPFEKIHFPAQKIAMMISIALRFIPTLMEETQRIMKAQASRGVDLENGKLKEKVLAILSLIIPLFVSALQRAEELAYAMEARGYVPSEKRTRFRVLKVVGSDVVALVLSICLLLGCIGMMFI